ncbi:autotransporter outer membrane beta-barrel domain-containing protein [Actinobacillus equuli subsp. equuli]|uniref:Autotransporter outer membrane beta-barrel domain-containing protein n=1 Tax=Actinobacillus equuli subsp. equuli TaxID=202947 RepID=A0A9X4G125_ACTEU|nr:autotransporter outer membrane beta-barrel domain-containing protein [Actinobacillus equuli]MDE8033561.1 autotransporter outer membrane beta-barrel domain-containing protein [Actinobacillus equuli subsp. equuli]
MFSSKQGTTPNNSPAVKVNSDYSYIKNNKSGDISSAGTAASIDLTGKVIVLENEGAIKPLASFSALTLSATDKAVILNKTGGTLSGNIDAKDSTLYLKNEGNIAEALSSSSAPQIKANNIFMENAGENSQLGSVNLEAKNDIHLKLSSGAGENITLTANNSSTTELDTDKFKFDKLTANGNNDTLTFLNSGTLNNATMSKLNGIEHLKLNNNWDVSEDYDFKGSLVNNNTLAFNSGSAVKFHRLSVAGNYTGNNGVLKMNVGNPHEHDQLVINGDASGHTNVELMNPKSVLGLEQKMKGKALLIKTGSSTADAFTLVKDTYGKYKYKLELKGTDWYLSQLNSLRNDLLAAMGNSALTSQMLFNQTYSDRTGAVRAEDSRLWLRNKFSHTRSQTNSLTAKTKSHHYGVQIGYDWIDTVLHNGTFTAGTFVGYGRESATSYGDDSSIKSHLTGYNVGLYASFENDNWYADSWAAYSAFKTKVDAEEEKFSYRNHSVQASAELGYKLNLWQGEKYSLELVPQAQLIYSKLSQPNLPEEAKLVGTTNWMSRVGTKVALHTPYKKTQPFVAFNLWHNSTQLGVVSEDEVTYTDGMRNIKEVKVGIENWNVVGNLNLSVNYSHRFGGKTFRDSAAQIGVNYKF